MTTFRAAAPTATTRELAQFVNELRDGKLNAIGSFVLTASATSTLVLNSKASIDTVILLMPLTASAAAALPTTWVSAQDNGQFTLTHSSDPATDRSFRYIAIG